MKSSQIVLAVFVVFGLIFSTTFIGCEYIEPGHVGIKVNLYGDQKGVEDFPLQTGRIWYNNWTNVVYEYPTYMQTVSWTDDLNEGSPVKESISFNSKEGAQISGDVALNYSLNPEKVPALFIAFRQSLETITNTYLRNQVRDAFNKSAGTFKAIEIFGEEKQKLLDSVKDQLTLKLEDKGFIIDSVSFIGAPRADTRVMNSIQSVIEATQRAIEAENKVRQSQAEAQQKVAEAEGQAESILKVAEAQAEANKKIAESLTPEVIRYKMLEQWDGIAPKYIGDANVLLGINDGQNN